MKLTGMKSAKIDITNELVTIAADDGPYVVLSSGITGTQLEISVLDLPTEARKVLYGIEVKDGMECTEEEIEDYCKELPRYKRPKKIIFAEVPRNATGKIEKPALRKKYGADKLVEQQNRS